MNPHDSDDPSAPKDSTRDQGPTALSLIRKIKDGHVSGGNLSSEDRQLCVAELIIQGASISETAEILGVSERTIARDRSVIRERNALKQDPRLAEEVAGRLQVEAEAAIGRLRRIARDKSNSASDQISAEKAAWEVLCELTEKLQSLGFLPTAARQVNAKLTYGIEEGTSIEAILTEIERVQAIQQDCLPNDVQQATLLQKTKEIVQKVILTSPEGDLSKTNKTNEENTK